MVGRRKDGVFSKHPISLSYSLLILTTGFSFATRQDFTMTVPRMKAMATMPTPIYIWGLMARISLKLVDTHSSPTYFDASVPINTAGKAMMATSLQSICKI